MRVDGLALRDPVAQMPQVAQAHRRAELVHLGVAADEGHLLRPVDAEILEVADALAERRVAVAEGAALDGVEDLGRMEGEHGRVPEAGGADPVPLHTEGVGRVIDDLETVRLRNAGDRIHIAQAAVDVDGQDRDRFLGDERFDLSGVDGIAHGVDVAEDRRAAAAHDGVRGGGEGVGRGDDLTVQIHGLDDILQREVPVGEQRHVIDAEILTQFFFKLLVLFAHVGQPVAVPDAADLAAVFLKSGEGGAGDVDGFGHEIPSFRDRHAAFTYTLSGSLRTRGC